MTGAEVSSGSAATGAAQVVSGSTAASVAHTQKSKQSLWIMGALLVAAIAVIAILLMPSEEGPALGESDVLLLTDFVNTTGDPVFDGTLKQALAVKLQESPYLNLLSERQVQDTLKLMNLPADERVTPEIGQEICERRGIKAMVTGEVASLGESFVVTLNAFECRTGESLARQQVEASSKEGVLTAVGNGAVNIRKDLGESLASIEQYDAPIEDATTSSLEALKAMAMGDRTRNQATEEEAIPFYKRALELDPDFAFAHARLGNAYANLREYDNAVFHKTRAYELRDEVSERERLYIMGHYHGTVTGDLNRLIETYELFKQAYPRISVAANNLCSDFEKFGMFERALTEGELAMSLDSENPLHYLNLAQVYRGLGRLDDSKQVLEDGFAMGFVRSGLYANRYLSAYLDGDTAKMDEMLEAMAGVPGESEILFFDAEGVAASGRLTEAHRLTRRAIDSARSYGFNERTADLLARSALWDAAFGLLDQSAARAAEALEIARSRDSMPAAAIAFAISGATPEAEALIQELTERYPETDTEIYSVWLPIATAAIALQNDNPAEAIEQLETVAPYERAFLIAIYLRGHAYLMLEQPDTARAEYEKLIELRGIDPTKPVHTLAHLGLGRALAAEGESTLARLQYEKFLDLVRNSDDGLPVVEAARDEYPNIQ
jgi:tetratricopeptide (TPR) repeat protein